VVKFVLKSFQSKLQDKRVRWFTDNQNVVRIMQHGSCKPALQAEDYDDYRLNPIIFDWLNSAWGPHTIDRFVNAHNSQLVRFNSRFYAPGSEAISPVTGLGKITDGSHLCTLSRFYLGMPKRQKLLVH